MLSGETIERGLGRDPDLFGELDAYSQDLQKLNWTGTFRDYVQMVKERPGVVRTSHQTLYSMIRSSGVETLPDGTRKYPFYETGQNAIYGSERALANLTGILESAAHGLETRRRIMLLMGPPGGGKSTIVIALKRGLERYSMTDEGATYAITDCPMNEEPMHLVPHPLRQRFEESLKIQIEGDLCPQCNLNYGDLGVKRGDLEDPTAQKGRNRIISLQDVPVRRILFSEKNRSGIGTFMPSDPKSQDMSELVGSVDLSKLGEHGSASSALAYLFDGELHIANRGVMEFVEMLKADERFLYVLLGLAQEGVIKAPRFPNVSADEVVVAHTNEEEYRKFVQKPEFAALRDRTLVVAFPYNLRVSDEVKIYEKLINQGGLAKGTGGRSSLGHINPNTLPVASTFAILSRLNLSKKAGMDNMRKLKIYDGQDVDGVSSQDAKALREEFPNEGMDGISPRYVIDSLSTALVKSDKGCLTPIDALRALRDGLDSHPTTRDMAGDKKEKLKNLVGEARGEYDERVKKEVQAAFLSSYQDSAQTMFDNYVMNIDGFVNKTKVQDPITEEEKDADEKMMRSIEEAVNVSESAKGEFRREIMTRIGTLAVRGEKFTYSSHPRLREAIETKLFADQRDTIKITMSALTPDEEQRKRIGTVVDRLVKEKGYCLTCANETLKYVGNLLSR